MSNLAMDGYVKHLYSTIDPNFNISIYNVTKRAVEVLHKINIYNLDSSGYGVSTQIQMLLSYNNDGILKHIKDILVYFNTTDNTNEKNMLRLKEQIDSLNRLCSQCEVIIENYERNSKLRLVPKNTKVFYFLLGSLFTLSIFLIKLYFNL